MSTPEERARKAAYMREWWKTEAGKRQKQRHKERLAADPAAREAARAKCRAWRQAHLEEQRARERENAARLRAEKPDLYRERRKADEKRRLAQRGLKAGRVAPLLCEICGRASIKGDKLVYDHCHKTGAFRGWLCDQCNWALGQVNDDPNILRAMIRYLEKARRSPEKKAA